MVIDLYEIVAGPSLSAALSKKGTLTAGLDELGSPKFVTEPMLAFMARTTLLAYDSLRSSVPISQGQLREAIGVTLPTADSPKGKVFIRDSVHYSSPKQKRQATAVVTAIRKAKASEGLTKIKTPTTQKELEAFRAGLTSAAEQLRRQGKSFRPSGAATILSQIELAFLLEKGGGLFRGKRRNAETKSIESVFIGQGGSLRSETFTRDEAIALVTKKFNTDLVSRSSKKYPRKRITKSVTRRRDTFDQIVDRLSQDKFKKQKSKPRKIIAREAQLRLEELENSTIALRTSRRGISRALGELKNANANEKDVTKFVERNRQIKAYQGEIDKINKSLSVHIREKQQLTATGVRSFESIRSEVEADLLEPYLRKKPTTTTERFEGFQKERNKERKSKVRELQDRAEAVKTQAPRVQQEIQDLERRISDNGGTPFEKSLLTRKKQQYAELTKTSRGQLASQIAIEKSKILDRKSLKASVEEFGKSNQWRRSKASEPAGGFSAIPKGNPTANWLGHAQTQLNEKLTADLGKLPADIRKASENAQRILERRIEEFLDFKKTTGVRRSF